MIPVRNTATTEKLSVVPRCRLSIPEEHLGTQIQIGLDRLLQEQYEQSQMLSKT